MTENTPFFYLLNALENAGSQANPAKNGYVEKRKAVLEYVAKIEAERDCAKNRVRELENKHD